MKKHIRISSAVLLCVVIGLIVSSCKKGDGDPFFSIYSRKARLSNNWKVSNFTSTYSYTNKKIEITFDGSAKKVVNSVLDTTINFPNPTPHDSVVTYSTEANYTGEITNEITNKGTYNYRESFTDNYSGIIETKEITGLWYFMGGNQQNEFKDKELLAMQVTNYVYNPNIGYSYTTIHQGEQTLDVYEIYALKNNKVVLKVNQTETINFIKYTTVMEYTYVPK